MVAVLLASLVKTRLITSNLVISRRRHAEHHKNMCLLNACCKCMLHDYFSSFNQSYYCVVALSLP